MSTSTRRALLTSFAAPATLRRCHGRNAGAAWPERLERRVLLATISGTVFEDADDDSVKDVGEAGLSGWTVYADDNWNGVKDATEPLAITNASGNYTLTTSSSGGQPSYAVRIVQQSSWRQTLGGYTYMRDANTYTGANFGETQKGMLRGTVFEDKNYNGVKYTSEPGIMNRTVYVDANNNAVRDTGEISATTTSGGAYTLRNLDPWVTHSVRLVDRAGYYTVAPDGDYLAAYLDPGADVAGANIGEAKTLYAPYDLTATRQSSGTQINLTWKDDNPDETGFRVEYSANGGAWTTLVTLGAGVLTYSATGLSSTTNYEFRVFATDANGDSYVSPTINPDAPPAPTDLRTESRAGSVKLTWNGSTGATSYTIYRSTTYNDPLGTPIATGVTATTYTDTTVQNGKEYYYYVKAVTPGVAPGSSASSPAGTGGKAATPSQPYFVTAIATLAMFNQVTAYNDPNDPTKGSQNHFEGGTIGVQKFDTNVGTLVDARSELIISQTMSGIASGGNPPGGYAVARTKEADQSQWFLSRGGLFTGRRINLNQAGKIDPGPIDSPPGNPGGVGMNEVTIINEVIACIGPSSVVTTRGFFTAFYAVTYNWTVPAAPMPMALTKAIAKREQLQGFFQDDNQVLNQNAETLN